MRNHVILLLFFLFPTIHFLHAFRSPSSLNAYRITNRRKPSFMRLRIRGDNAEEGEQSPNVATPQTEQQIKTPIDVILNEDELEETFAKGSGKGGQKINKTMNRVVLVHKPTGLRVSCQEVRDLDTNRKLARRMLVEKLDVYYNQELSKLRIEQQKVRKRKSDAKRYVTSSSPPLSHSLWI